MRKRQKTSAAGTDGQRQRLERAKLRPLGLLESVRMRRLGRQDGLAGLPRRSEEGVWDSPLLYQEFSAYSEFCDREWGAAQLELQDDYAAVEGLLDAIRRREAVLERLLQNVPAPSGEEQPSGRLPGEEALSDTQVQARRRREAERRKLPYHAQVQALQRELQSAYDELDRRQGRILETNNAARLICQRLQKHTEQRAAAYWSAALRVHPAKAQLPARPEPLPQSEAELTYLAQHRTLEDEAVAMLARRARLLTWQDPAGQEFPALAGKKKGAA